MPVSRKGFSHSSQHTLGSRLEMLQDVYSDESNLVLHSMYQMRCMECSIELYAFVMLQVPSHSQPSLYSDVAWASVLLPSSVGLELDSRQAWTPEARRKSRGCTSARLRNLLTTILAVIESEADVDLPRRTSKNGLKPQTLYPEPSY